MTTPDQFLAQHKANVDSLFALTGKVFDGMEKLMALNLQAAKASMAEGTEAAKAALSVKDAQQLMTLQQALLQPAAEKAAAYSRQLYDIASSVGAEVGKVVEAKAAEAKSQFTSVVDTAMSQFPGDTGGASAMVKSAMSAADQLLASVQQAAKQAASVVEANAQSVAASITPAATTKAKR